MKSYPLFDYIYIETFELFKYDDIISNKVISNY